MVRCEDFYKYFERKGNFCGKSENVVKKVEDYIAYVKRHRLMEFSGYRISNAALDPFISVENMKDGKVHDLALKELKRLIRKRKKRMAKNSIWEILLMIQCKCIFGKSAKFPC